MGIPIQLYEKLSEKLGKELATKEDILLVRQEIETVRQEIETVRQELDGKIESLRQEVKGELKVLKMLIYFLGALIIILNQNSLEFLAKLIFGAVK